MKVPDMNLLGLVEGLDDAFAQAGTPLRAIAPCQVGEVRRQMTQESSIHAIRHIAR